MKLESVWAERARVCWVNPVLKLDISENHVQWEGENGWVTSLTRDEFFTLLKEHRDKRDGHMKQIYEKDHP